MPSPPRVLLVHNRYREPGGEERAVEQIAGLLARRGHAVEVLERRSDALRGARGRATAGAALLGGGLRPDAVGQAARAMRADVVHVHNMLPLFGPRALAAGRDAGARVVLHLHNFRLFCAIGVAYRDGAPCHRCRGRDTTPGVRLRCRGGLAEGAVYAAGLALHQPAAMGTPQRLLVPSRAGLEALALLGLPREKADVLPNFLAGDGFSGASRAGEGAYALFAGRLVEEKGTATAIAAARAARVPLRIAGAGPDEDRLRALAGGDPLVRLLGRLTPERLADERAGAAFAVVPSRSEEMCPYAAIEALAAGLPVLASDLGGLTELVGVEHALPAGDERAWAAAMGRLWADRPRRSRLGEETLAAARVRFGEAAAYAGLLEAYAAA